MLGIWPMAARARKRGRLGRPSGTRRQPVNLAFPFRAAAKRLSSNCYPPPIDGMSSHRAWQGA